MSRRHFNFRLAYIDLLLNFMVGLIFILLISQPIQKKTVSKSEGIKKNAEMMITATWNPKIDCDVDMWVRDPNGNTVWFNQKDAGIMHIERDDLGFRNDIITTTKELITGVKVNNLDNQEVWVLRGKLAGEFSFNIHLYACRIGDKQFTLGDPFTLPVDIKMIKINPDYTEVYVDTVTFDHVWQEITVLNFTLDADGNIVAKNKDTRQLVKTRP